MPYKYPLQSDFGLFLNFNHALLVLVHEVARGTEKAHIPILEVTNQTALADLISTLGTLCAVWLFESITGLAGVADGSTHFERNLAKGVCILEKQIVLAASHFVFAQDISLQALQTCA